MDNRTGDTPSPRKVPSHPLRPSALPRGSSPLLCISADVLCRDVIRRIVAQWRGVRLLHTAEAASGLKLAAERSPGLIFLDASVADSEKVLVRLRGSADTSRTPVVVLGSHPQIGDRARFVWQGASAYETKPIDVSRLRRVIFDLLVASQWG